MKPAHNKLSQGSGPFWRPDPFINPAETTDVPDRAVFENASSIFDEKHKKEVHDRDFPQDLAKAYALGKKLAE